MSETNAFTVTLHCHECERSVSFDPYDDLDELVTDIRAHINEHEHR